MFGKEHVLVAVLVMFALGSLVAALSHSIGVLVAGRAIQGFAGAVFPLLFVPESPIKVPAKIDWVGAGLLSLGLGTLLLGISQGPSWGWSSTRVLGLFALAVVSLVAWVRFELHVPAPLVDMRMMLRRAV